MAVPPHFTIRPQNQRVRQGLTVDFPCRVAGRPQPHVVWTVNGMYSRMTLLIRFWVIVVVCGRNAHQDHRTLQLFTEHVMLLIV